jgi:hypothetical protein
MKHESSQFPNEAAGAQQPKDETMEPFATNQGNVYNSPPQPDSRNSGAPEYSTPHGQPAEVPGAQYGGHWDDYCSYISSAIPLGVNPDGSIRY